MEKLITDLIPNEGLKLVKYSGNQFVDKLGMSVVQNVVTSILMGDNVRDLTEGLTQRRVLMTSASILATYLRVMNGTDDVIKDLTNLIKSNLNEQKLTDSQKTYLCWFLGLTGKSIQNVIRDSEGFKKYLDILDENLKDISNDVINVYGDISLNINFEGHDFLLKWPNLLRCLLATGAQTLTIRGSEKSLYGKMFEKLVLGSVLTLLGFELIDKDDTTKSNKVFWLSERKNKRESDATLLIKPGDGIRFDIGFIGRGNTEVSLDKVTRFERYMERGFIKYNTSTIILVDTIGDGSRIVDMAKEIDGSILQMSATYWVYELSQLLLKKNKYRSPLTGLTKEQTIDYIKEKMKEVDLNKFIIATKPAKKSKKTTKKKAASTKKKASSKKKTTKKKRNKN